MKTKDKAADRQARRRHEKKMEARKEASELPVSPEKRRRLSMRVWTPGGWRYRLTGAFLDRCVAVELDALPSVLLSEVLSHGE